MRELASDWYVSDFGDWMAEVIDATHGDCLISMYCSGGPVAVTLRVRRYEGGLLICDDYTRYKPDGPVEHKHCYAVKVQEDIFRHLHEQVAAGYRYRTPSRALDAGYAYHIAVGRAFGITLNDGGDMDRMAMALTDVWYEALEDERAPCGGVNAYLVEQHLRDEDSLASFAVYVDAAIQYLDEACELVQRCGSQIESTGQTDD